MKPVEELGLLKMDFLGLRNLDVIEDALDIIERSTGERPDMTKLPLDDAKTYEMLARGDSVGVFQFESEGMQSALRKVKPTEFDDLVALVALYRPGAMDQIPTYARGKRNPDAVSVPDERLEPIIGPTYGVILYQEQAMQISKELAGFSGAKADDLRKAIGKKNREAMAELEPEFRDGLPRQRRRAATSSTGCGTTNEKSADYSFNKSHAACYALIAYRTAWLKANYPRRVHGRADLLGDGHQGQGPVLRRALRGDGDRDPAARRQPLRPRVRRRRRQHPLRPGRRQGRRLRGGRGDQGARARRAAPFASIWDFCARVDPRAVNKRAIEALIKCGAFGSTGASRKGMLDVLEQAQAAGQKAQLDAQIGQGSIFDLGDLASGARAAPRRPFAAPAHPPIPPRGVRAGRAAGASRRRPSGCSSRRTRSRRCARRCAPRSTRRWPSCPTARTATGSRPAASSPQAKKIRTKKGDPMMFATLDDLEGSVEVLIFGKALAEYEGALGVDEVVLVRGRVDHGDKGTSLIVQTVEPFAAHAPRRSRPPARRPPASRRARSR